MEKHLEKKISTNFKYVLPDPNTAKLGFILNEPKSQLGFDSFTFTNNPEHSLG